MKIIYSDDRVFVCEKPAGVLSTDEAGGMPELIRAALSDENATVKTVHRLDRVVGGIMLFARTKRAAAELSQQVYSREFTKEYLAVVHGKAVPPSGELVDMLERDLQSHRTFVAGADSQKAQRASLGYKTLAVSEGLSLLQISLHTGRTHQIRVQCASRNLPIIGDKRYGKGEDCPIALWSHRLGFTHPRTGERMEFLLEPPRTFPWDKF